MGTFLIFAAGDKAECDELTVLLLEALARGSSGHRGRYLADTSAGGQDGLSQGGRSGGVRQLRYSR